MTVIRKFGISFNSQDIPFFFYSDNQFGKPSG